MFGSVSFTNIVDCLCDSGLFHVLINNLFLVSKLFNMSSPEKKRMKYDPTGVTGESENLIIPKRLRSQIKTEQEVEKQLKSLRKKNFVNACEKVSCETYFNRQKRLQLVNVPACAKGSCKHSLIQEFSLREMPTYAKKSFKIELSTGMWYEALEVCQISITSDQYLPAEVMKDIVEIMMNVHDDIYVSYTVDELIDKCQHVLALNVSTHPPCPTLLRKCYRNFLTTPMDHRQNTFTNRQNFGSSEGIVKYCMNRLEDDIKAGSKDEPIINKYENTPSEMKECVKGLHWEKEKFEIFELLERPDRIRRLMAVLESIIELLQHDLAIWQRRYTSKMGSHIMELKNKPLLAFVLWQTSALNTGAVTKNCQQIINLFIYFIHLQYPEEHVQIMTTWLNTITEIFYICETNSNSDYPNLGKYCGSFATKFYESMTSNEKGLSNDSVIRILERIQPSFMRYLIGMHITKSFLYVTDDNIIGILVEFIRKRQWEEYTESNSLIQVMKSESISGNSSNILLDLLEQCLEETSLTSSDNNNNLFPKFLPPDIVSRSIEQNHVVHTLYITLEAYLDAYSVQSVQDTLDELNAKLTQDNIAAPSIHIDMPKPGQYSVSEEYIKKYRTIYQTLKDLLTIVFEMRENNAWPRVLDVFNNILLG